MIINRIRQFWYALFSRIGSKEISFVEQYLNKEEQFLFYNMDLPTQTHCIRVAQTCLKLLPKDKKVNLNVLIKAALLHDIGKPANFIRTIDRVLIVLLSTFLPQTYNKILNIKSSDYHIFNAFKAHAKHPTRGAAIARKQKINNEIIYLIESHHRSINHDDTWELKLLKKADEMN